MSINRNEITNEIVSKAMQRETAEKLMALAKVEGIELAKEEAETYIKKLADFELDDDQLKSVAGGKSFCHYR